MSRTSENTAFTCLICDLEVAPLSNGSYRNHCPGCLYSQHLDLVPGDRASSCEGMMEPVELFAGKSLYEEPLGNTGLGHRSLRPVRVGGSSIPVVGSCAASRQERGDSPSLLSLLCPREAQDRWGRLPSLR